MKEENRQQLEQALRQLPVYQPGEQLWSEIDLKLSLAREQRKLKEAVQQLPVYAPPSSVWTQIASQLPGAPQPGRVIQLAQRSWVRVAAVVLFIFGGYYIWQNAQNTSGEIVRVTLVAEPVADLNVFTASDPFEEEDENLIQEAVQLFSNSYLAKSQNQYDVLMSEWEELSAARTSIKEALSLYGKDPGLIQELKDIELARSELIRKMSKWI